MQGKNIKLAASEKLKRSEPGKRVMEYAREDVRSDFSYGGVESKPPYQSEFESSYWKSSFFVFLLSSFRRAASFRLLNGDRLHLPSPSSSVTTSVYTAISSRLSFSLATRREFALALKPTTFRFSIANCLARARRRR